jgi:hypothetical protein
MSIENNTRRAIRCCSQCGQTGHNIRTCTRDIFDVFREYSAFQSEEEREEVTDITVRSIEYALRRELVLFTMSNILTDFITIQDNANSKLNVLCNVNNDENEDIHKLCECSICYEEKEVKNYVKLNCSHEFCYECVINQVKARQSMPTICCALCRTDVKEIQCRTNYVKEQLNEYTK